MNLLGSLLGEVPLIVVISVDWAKSETAHKGTNEGKVFTTRMFVKKEILPFVETPNQVPFLSKSLGAMISGISDQV